MQRVLTALAHREGDRVPFVHCLSFYGARELGLSIQEYFESAENAAEARDPHAGQIPP